MKRVPIAPTRTRGRLGVVVSAASGHQRLMEVHVLLAVHDEHQRFGRDHVGRRDQQLAPRRHDPEDRRRVLPGLVGRVVVVGRGRVRLGAIRIDDGRVGS